MRFLLPLMLVAAPAAAQQLPVVELRAGMHLIRAEVAADYSTRGRGLMFRKSLAPNGGMLFIFDAAEIHCMWMKNTYIPLSVAFVDAQGAIINIADMQPHSEQSHCAARPAVPRRSSTRCAASKTRNGWPRRSTATTSQSYGSPAR